ncbi:NAD-dependent epimerase/dehydratase family protein [Methylosinus sp. Ce-a6]|uniref:NAD-dependent epimerase/dehydratase family protein n=1 Tax=Methylosinus sp. Ce-a6 TaxID=2172005 RepID=UPI00135A9A86|nr:NAD-dependent epimerase/dehydratase family protein [Methylosinus sp. Ce-a6]
MNAAPDGGLLLDHPLYREDIAQIVETDLPWDALAGRTVLVTGANGFLPAMMVDALLALAKRRADVGLGVLALVRSRERAERRFRAHLHDRALTIFEGDAAEPFDPPGAVDVVIHAASQASPRYYGVDPVGTAAPNVIGTMRLLDLARRKNASRFLYFSSSEVYGALAPQEQPAQETVFGRLDPATQRACYAESKRMGETLCVAHHAQYGAQAVIVRPFHTYGPGMRLDDGRVFADFVRDVVTGRDIVLNSDGSAERAFCYLADAVRAFFAVLLKGEAGLAYNVGNPEAVASVRALAETLIGLYPQRGVSLRSSVPPSGYIPSQIQRSAPDTTRLEALGWRPTVGIAEGFKRTIDIYSDIFGAAA